MLKNRRSTKKVLALFLVFTIMFANMFTVVEYAASNLGKLDSSDVHENVEYDAELIVNEEKKGYEAAFDMNEENAGIKLKLKVQDSGYLKNASISFESEKGLNFEIGEVQKSDLVQGLENNKLKLNQLNAGDKLEFVVPIKFKDTDSIDNLSKVVSAKLSGVYVDNSGDENKISETVNLRVTWNLNTELTVSSELTKYIPYNFDSKSGVIVQTKVRMNMGNKPELVEKEKLEIDALKLSGMNLEKVTVIRNNEADFSEKDWKHSDNKITIDVKNDNSKEFIKEEFLITYIFTGTDKNQLPLNLNSKISATVEMFGSKEKIEAQKEELYTVSEKVGEIVSISSEFSEEILNKGNIIADKYNEAKAYSTNYEINHRINISSIDLVEKISITDIDENFKAGENSFSTVNSSLYKKVKVSKDEFSKILGTDGKISIMSRGEEIATITKDSRVEDGSYVAEISIPVSRVTINTTAPKAEGNLNIKLNKEIKDTEYDLATIKALDSILYTAQGAITLTGDAQNKVADISNTIKLENTKTDTNISLNKSSLSTIANNENVEMNISLNNDKLGTDFYKNPKFEITLPEYIQEVDFKDVGIANGGEDFKISKADANVEDGKVVIRIDLEGTQKSYPLNNVTDGTNIIINTNMRLNLLTPSKEDKITLRYMNEDATEYLDNGYEEAKLSYVAPTGVISVNSTSNYNGENSKVMSVEQGTKTDKIEIFDNAKTAKMDILVMNNNKNTTKDVKILGRIPFKGVKDVRTGEDLGTTVDTVMISQVIANQENSASVTIYYSENGEATADLTDMNNGWRTDIADLSKVKSYLIVTDNYEMNKAEVLRFSYEYVIPENLEHNNYVYGTFGTLYKDVSEIAENDEISTPDLVGLTTGKGPNISVETKLSTGKDSIKESEKVKYTAEIKNTGEEDAREVEVKTELPNGATFVEYQKQGSIYEEKGWKYKDGKESVEKFDVIKPGETKVIEFVVEANSVSEDLKTMDWKTEVKAKDLAKTLESDVITSSIEKGEIVAEETSDTIADIVRGNDEITYKIAVKNTSDKDISNVRIEKDLPDLLKYSESYVQDFDKELNLVKNTANSDYDIDNRKVTWTIDNIKAGHTKYVVLNAVAGELAGDVYEDVITTNSKVTANSNTYYTAEVTERIARPKLVVEQVSNQNGEFIGEGEEVEYTLKVKNEGIVQADQVEVTDIVPNELKIRSLKYRVDGAELARTVSKNEDAVVYTSLAPQSELVVNLSAIANNIEQAQKSVSNVATVDMANADTVTTNKVNNVIERTTNTEADNSSDSRYKITGLAWIDLNQNGQRDENENGLEGIEAVLVDTNTLSKIQTVATGINGEYTFNNIPNGNYYVIFYYNSTRFSVATYRKENVPENLNSNVISANIEEDGITREVAVTDAITISNGSISNINIGLAATNIFDLKLEETISAITVQNENGTKKNEYNNLTLAKVEIAPKDLADTKVLVEYNITVKNEGDVEGYAKKIVDYLPEGMEFSTELNKNWYQGSDGNLYNEELSNTAIPAGESKTITLVLLKQMTEENTGIVTNTVEIAESYNKLGLPDKDSTPNNKAQNEDDLARADAILSINTGSTLVYITAIATTIMMAIILFIVIRMNRYKIKWYLQKKEVN